VIKRPYDPSVFRSAETGMPNRIGSYEMTDEEVAEVMRQNVERGTLHLILERNSGMHRPGVKRKFES
jgi:alanine racemase